MKKDENTSIQKNRRTFLTRAAAISGGAAVVAASGSIQAEPIDTVLPENEKPNRGYQETAHVQAYYKTLSA